MMWGNSRRFLLLASAIALVALGWGCGGSTPANVITVTLFPTTPTVLVNGTQQFQVSVVGTTDRTVTWTLNDKPASDTMSPVGKISVDGLYTAPATIPNPAQTITVKATANADKKSNATATITLDSGIRVTVIPATATVGTGETFAFSVSVSNDPTKSVTWSVKETNAGTIDANGIFTAPATVPSPATATIIATSKIDTTRTGSATVTIVTAQAATFSGISPTKAPQGGLFQDVYLAVTNLRSTSVVKFDGQTIDDPSQLIVIGDKLARLRLLAKDLTKAGTFTVSVDGATIVPGAPDKITIMPVRPAIVESFPDSLPQTLLNPSLTVNGGYIGTFENCPSLRPGVPVVTAEFNGSDRPILLPPDPFSPRQLTMNLGSGDLAQPGLYSVGVRNKNNRSLAAITNVAVQPNPSPGPSLLTQLILPDTAAPTAMAIDTVAGIAIVANTGNNTVQRINVAPDSPVLLGGPIVAASPVGVAVDEIRHIALVLNSGDKTVSRIDLLTGAVTGTVDLTAVFGQPAATPIPAAVGIEPNSGLALVVYQSTNAASILRYIDPLPPTLPGCLFGTAPPCIVGGVTVSTGAAPQIAVDPRLKWAFVTPGDAGPLSIVDLNQQGTSVKIADAPNGAKRTSNIVTITTQDAHNLNPTIPTSVAITGVADASFNGTFSVASVPDAKTFTYSQTAPNASSGGGQVRSGRPLVTVAVGNTIRGIAINPVSARVLLTDVNSNAAPILSELDQTSTTVDIGHPANAAAFNPFTNVGVLVKSNTVGAGPDIVTLVDPARPAVIKNDIPTGGQGAAAVAIDPGTNRAFVVNTTSHSVSVISHGAIKTVHVGQIIIPEASRQLIPNFTLVSNAPLTIRITGKGFMGSPKVRLDGTEIPTAPTANDRQFDVPIPASFLTAPRRYSLDVVNGAVSNSMDFTVVQAVPIPASAGCANSAPAAGAIAPGPDIVIVANAGAGCNSASLVDLNTGTVISNIAVGTRPEGVAVLSRAGRAVVTNNGSDTASIVDITSPAAPKIIEMGNVTTGKGPLGVAINQDTGVAVVTNTQSNSISLFDATVGGTASSTGTSQLPLAVSIDPTRNVAMVASSQAGVFDVFNLSAASATPSATLRGSVSVGGFGGNPLPTSTVFDAASGSFFGSGSLGNQVFVIDPDTGRGQTARVGVNPA